MASNLVGHPKDPNHPRQARLSNSGGIGGFATRPVLLTFFAFRGKPQALTVAFVKIFKEFSQKVQKMVVRFTAHGDQVMLL